MDRRGRSGRARARARGRLSDREQTMSWINLTALGEIVVFGLLAGAGLPAIFALGLLAGLLAGAGLPAIFALGLLALSMKGGRAQTAGADSDQVIGGNPAGIVIATFCFLVVLAAIAWGIYEVYQ